MLLLMGGFAGSGRILLGKEFARLHGFYYYPKEKRRLHTIQRDSRGIREQFPMPKNDAEWMHIYGRVARDLPLLSKMYPGVVISDLFHRHMVREYIQHEGEKAFGKVVFVWIDFEEEHMIERLKKRGMDEDEAQMSRRYMQQQKETFQPLGSNVASVSFNDSMDDALAALHAAAGMESALSR